MPHAAESMELKLNRVPVSWMFLGFYHCQDALFSGFWRTTHVVSYWLRIFSLSLHHANLWLPLSEAGLDPENRQGTYFQTLPHIPHAHPSLEGRRWERRKMCGYWLWMGSIRLTSLPALPTAPQKYFPFWWPPRMFYYGFTCEPYDIFYPKPRIWEKIDPNPRLDKAVILCWWPIPLLESLS